jgi:hypothetical protein
MINAGAVRVPEGAGFDPGLEITVAPQLTQFQNAITAHQAGYYQSGLYIETDAATDAKVFQAAEKKALSQYDVLGSSCIHACTQPLIENNVLPGRFGARRLPNMAYDAIAEYLGKRHSSEFLQFQNRYSWETFYLERFNFAKPTIQVGQIQNLGFVPD